MSKSRNLLPLALATAFGIFNGVWVFGPALKEQQEQKQVETGKVLRELEKEDPEITKQRDVNMTTPITSFAELSSTVSATPTARANSWWQSQDTSVKDETNALKGSMEHRVEVPIKTEK